MNVCMYKECRIYFDPPPVGTRELDWQWAHKDFDGPEDFRSGFGPSIQACKDQIDYMEIDGA